MAKIPITGPISITNIRQARNIDGTAGTTSNTYSVLRNGANFSRFDPTYLQGATQLSQVNAFSQWRGYPIDVAITINWSLTANNFGEGFITINFINQNSQGDQISQVVGNNQTVSGTFTTLSGQTVDVEVSNSSFNVDGTTVTVLENGNTIRAEAGVSNAFTLFTPTVGNTYSIIGAVNGNDPSGGGGGFF
jgi:hypothetical protein